MDKETDAVEDTEGEVNPLEMSDEAFDALMFGPGDDEEVTEPEETSVEEESETVSDEEEVVEEDTTATDESESDDSESEEEEDTPTEEGESDVTDDSEEEDTDEPEITEEELIAEILSSDEKLDQIFSPFKANGKEMKVDNIDDVRSLMQMGANYNKKMAGLKPNLKLLKMLENNDLLDEAKLNYLIDLDKKNPDAVTKLLKDSQLDPDELDIEAESSYKPNTYTVNDKEVELDDTLNEIRDTPSYATTLTIISNKWDESSRAALLDNPAGIKVLNDHVDQGIYDIISSAVETERMFGRIPNGMSDLDAYKQVGDAINARGGFNPSNSTSESKIVSGRPATKSVDPSVNSKKKAASSTKSSPKGKPKSDFNPLALSDAEFEKMAMDKFI